MEWEVPRLPLQYERAVLAGALVRGGGELVCELTGVGGGELSRLPDVPQPFLGVVASQGEEPWPTEAAGDRAGHGFRRLPRAPSTTV
ncbi:hypothetical protein [Streptomyces sp. NPDC127119]|uniref:hypothetical protein n=1 Tax=Streptomyces sp. NPDC127119 TaxID=3345370 RepID=UPI0036386FB4